MGFWGGRFRVASAIAFDPQGHAYVADFYNNRIQEFTLGGSYLGQWRDLGLNGPTGLAVDREGYLYIADFHYNRIVKIQVQ
jgi:DNA-binding beta-propeller fold protein YncE